MRDLQREVDRLRTEVERLREENEIFRKGASAVRGNLDVQDRLNQQVKRWAFIKSDPESAQHLLLLLSLGKGTEDDFDRMIDRLIASKAEAQKATHRGGGQ